MRLFDPIYRTVNLNAMSVPGEAQLDPQQAHLRALDRAKAAYIESVMEDAMRAHKQQQRGRFSLLQSPVFSGTLTPPPRKPKAIVFSQNTAHLQVFI